MTSHQCVTCARTTGLLAYPELRCYRCTSPADRELLADLDRRAPSIGIRPGYWPYGPNIDVVARRLMTEWAEQHGLRESTRGGCLHWIARGRCAVAACREDRNTYAWMDHVSAWNRGGKPAVLVCQPYPSVNVAEIAAVADKWALQLRISSDSGWYGHGTWWVALWAPAAAEVCVAGDFWAETRTSVLEELLQDADAWGRSRGATAADQEAFISSLTAELARRDGLASVISITGDSQRQR